MSGAINNTPGLSPARQVVLNRSSDFGLGGTNYLLSPSNDNEEKIPRKFVEEGFKNSLAGAASSSGKWATDTSDAAINQAIPNHMQGVEVSRREFINGQWVSGQPSSDYE